MDATNIVGGSFLLADANPADIFTPEDFTQEHREIAKTAKSFSDGEILPNAEAIHRKDFALTRKLLKASAELGLVGADIPEQYGGMALDKVSSAIITEKLAANADFLVTFAAHAGIGTLPVAYFGTEEQKAAYLPRLLSGEIIGAYALTEPGAGSDAQAIKTTATLSADGSAYVLNGSKLWITNAGFADIFTVFAKVDGDANKIAAFLVERATPGFVIGAEEHKVGIKGSSTCPLMLDAVCVPARNMLIGDGLKIALNVLNMGRFKLGIGCVGGSKTLIRIAADYAKGRKTFGRAIGEYGLIRHKIARMISSTWLCEGMAYRMASLLDTALAAADGNPAAMMKAVAQHAIECAMVKVYGSDMLYANADDAVQIHGGNGYMEENPAARTWCDARINLIFEGTNEINRLVISGTMLKNAQKGVLGIFSAATKYAEALVGMPMEFISEDGVLRKESVALSNLKRLTVMLYGALAGQCLAKGRNIEDEQEVFSALADMATDVFALETGIARVKKIAGCGKNAEQETAIVKSAVSRIIEAADARAKFSVRRLYDGDDRRIYLAGVKRLTKYEADDSVELDRDIAARYLAGEWNFA